ncbi:hypothetical protein LTR17_022890 [Elasticomyces elasticus]|nr:hypothetical protein LTR17_022890 [Elasticomyces elasticus]
MSLNACDKPNNVATTFWEEIIKRDAGIRFQDIVDSYDKVRRLTKCALDVEESQLLVLNGVEITEDQAARVEEAGVWPRKGREVFDNAMREVAEKGKLEDYFELDFESDSDSDYEDQDEDQTEACLSGTGRGERPQLFRAAFTRWRLCGRLLYRARPRFAKRSAEHRAPVPTLLHLNVSALFGMLNIDGFL